MSENGTPIYRQWEFGHAAPKLDFATKTNTCFFVSEKPGFKIEDVRFRNMNDDRVKDTQQQKYHAKYCL